MLFNADQRYRENLFKGTVRMFCGRGVRGGMGRRLRTGLGRLDTCCAPPSASGWRSDCLPFSELLYNFLGRENSSMMMRGYEVMRQIMTKFEGQRWI